MTPPTCPLCTHPTAGHLPPPGAVHAYVCTVAGCDCTRDRRDVQDEMRAGEDDDNDDWADREPEGEGWR